jgi:hypothetical protein
MTVSFPRPYFVGKRGFILFHSVLMVAVFAATHAMTARRAQRTGHDGERFDFDQRFEIRRNDVKVRWQMVVRIDRDNHLPNLMKLAHIPARRREINIVQILDYVFEGSLGRAGVATSVTWGRPKVAGGA